MNTSLRQYYLTEIGIRSWQLKSTPDTDFIECDYEPLEEKKPLEKKSLVVSHESLVENPEPLAEDQEPSAKDQEPSAKDQEPSAEEAQQPSADKKPLVVNQEPSALNQKPVAAQNLKVKAVNISAPEIPDISPFDVELINTIEACKVCSNRQSRLKPLIGEGNTNAAVFFISDAPTATEEREGHYLTGDIQFLFKSMLRVIGLENDYFFSAMIKCYSLEEYLISEDEINHCRTHLIAQLKHIKPKVIVALGPVQAQAILNTNKSFNQLRNKVHAVEINSSSAISAFSTFSTFSTASTSTAQKTTQSCPVIVTYHPSFLLRNPLYKKEALRDLLLIKDLLEDRKSKEEFEG